MNVCSTCGVENADGTRFCVKCGSTLATAPSPGSWQTPSGNLYGSAPSGGLGNQQYVPPGVGQPAQDYSSAPNYNPNAYGQPPASSYQPSAPSYQPGAPLYNPQTYGPNAPSQAGMKADPVVRIGSFLLDVVAGMLLMIPFALMAFIPFVGIIVGLLFIPLCAVTYHLLRDIQGQSPGKYLIGMRVISKTGGDSTNGQRVLRNLPLAVPAMFMIIPIIGHFIGGLLGFVIVTTELIMLLAAGERLGDRLANTMVIKTK
jgi:uncharacterized RDD family membrane protein YckC